MLAVIEFLAAPRPRPPQPRGSHAVSIPPAIARVDRADRDLGIHAIEVFAIDNAAKGFYLKYGFTKLADDPHHLFISMKTIRKLGLGKRKGPPQTRGGP